MGQIFVFCPQIQCCPEIQSRNPSKMQPNFKETIKEMVEQKLLKFPTRLKPSETYYDNFFVFHKESIPIILTRFKLDEDPLILHEDNLKLTVETTENNAYKQIKQHIEAAQDCPIKSIIDSYNQFLWNLFNIPQNTDSNEGIDSSTTVKPNNSLSLSASQISTYDQYGKQSPFIQSQQSQQQIRSNNQYQNLHYRIANSYDSIRQGSPRIENPRVRLIEDKLIKNFGLSTLLLVQVNDMLKCIRYLILSYYKTELHKYFKNNEKFNEFQTREILFEKIEQCLLISKNGPLILILQYIIKYHYIEQKQLQRLNKSRNSNHYQPEDIIANKEEPILDITLIPPSNRTSNEFELQIEESEEQDSSIQYNIVNNNQMFKNNYDYENLPIIEENEEEVKTQVETQTFMRASMRREDVLKMIQRSELNKQTKQPYQETFPLLEKLIRANRPYEKFQLILKLDRMIVQVFLRCRSESQINKVIEHISAEDSKTEILFFILYKFWKQTNEDLNQNLLVYLKCMHDYDAILNYELKYVYCPAFVRFYSILDMLVCSEI